MRERDPIEVWRFCDAPEEYRNLSTNGGDEDWVAFVPDYLTDDPYIGWMKDGGPFGCAGVDEYEVSGGVVRIGCHA